MYGESSPVAGLEHEIPSRMEGTLTTVLQPHASGKSIIYHGDR